MDKRDERLSSELSELDSDDGEDIEPDHYWDGGKIPVFKPVCCIPLRGIAAECSKLALSAPSFKTLAHTGNGALTDSYRRQWISFVTFDGSSIRSTNTA